MGLAHSYFLDEPSIGPAQDEDNLRRRLGLRRVEHFTLGLSPAQAQSCKKFGAQARGVL